MTDEQATPAILESTVLRHADGVQAHQVMSELVLYDTAGNKALSLNGSARTIWEKIDGTKSVAELADAIGADLGCSDDAEVVAELRSDIAAFAADLTEKGLISPVS